MSWLFASGGQSIGTSASGQLTSVQLLNRVQLFETPWTAARQASLSITNSWNLCKFISIELVMPPNLLTLCHPFLLLLSFFLFPQHQAAFQWVNCLHQVAKVLEFQLQHQSVLPMNVQDQFPFGLTGWIFLKFKRLSRVFFNTTVQKYQHSSFFMVQLSYPYMTTGKAIDSTDTSVQLSSIAQLCPTLHDPMDCSRPGLPVHHQLPELAQIHIHWICDAIQPFHPLSSPSSLAFSLSQDQGLFQGGSSLNQVAKILEFQIIISLPVNIQDWYPLWLTSLISYLSKTLSQKSSPKP